MTPRDIVLEQLHHRETSPVPFKLDFEGDVARNASMATMMVQRGGKG